MTTFGRIVDRVELSLLNDPFAKVTTLLVGLAIVPQSAHLAEPSCITFHNTTTNFLTSTRKNSKAALITQSQPLHLLI